MALMRALGKTLQILGLILLPLAMILEMSQIFRGIAEMLMMLVFGASVFYVGRLLEGYSKR